MKKLLVLTSVVGILAATAPAHAHGLFSLHIGVPGVSVNIGVPPPPLVIHRAPFCAPPAVVIAPPRVYLPALPVVIVPRRVMLPPPPVVIYRPYRYHAFCP